MTGYVRCSFYERVASGKKLFRYDALRINCRDTYLPLFHPPLVGDLVFLPGQAGGFRVIDRDWSYPAYGSADWPHGEPAPIKGPLMQVLVTAAVGLFRDEEPYEESEEDGQS